jgi:hypothetical protein
MQLDAENLQGKNISKEALILITKATEIFLGDLSGVCAQLAKNQKRKTLGVADINAAANHIERFHFIKDSRLPSLGAKNSEKVQESPSKIEEVDEEEV